jgi:EAL domain-containing protein (putative c-di-GMP-specific phosphodiesterase class I)
MQNAKSTASVLQELKRMGVHLAVDDFGTGYSSLSYLRQFPIDVLKIDQCFVRQISGDPNDSAIVRAIIDMGKNLKLRVIAGNCRGHRNAGTAGASSDVSVCGRTRLPL